MLARFFVDHKLVPDLGSNFGQDVDKYRKLVEALKVETISYGVMINRSLSTTGIQVPRLITYYVTPERVCKYNMTFCLL